MCVAGLHTCNHHPRTPNATSATGSRMRRSWCAARLLQTKLFNTRHRNGVPSALLASSCDCASTANKRQVLRSTGWAEKRHRHKNPAQDTGLPSHAKERSRQCRRVAFSIFAGRRRAAQPFRRVTKRFRSSGVAVSYPGTKDAGKKQASKSSTPGFSGS